MGQFMQDNGSRSQDLSSASINAQEEHAARDHVI